MRLKFRFSLLLFASQRLSPNLQNDTVFQEGIRTFISLFALSSRTLAFAHALCCLSQLLFLISLSFPTFVSLFPVLSSAILDLGIQPLYLKRFGLPRKEVIQPHLPIRLPCYDFTPVISLTFDGCSLSVHSPASGAPNSHGVTGGVYKARERIHRGMLIRDY